MPAARRSARGAPTVVSLFSGCGGFDEGFRLAGFDTLAAFDIDPEVVRTYNSNLRPVAKVCDLALSNPVATRPDVLIAGSPCQGFSTAGLRLVADPRNDLLIRAGKIAIDVKPKVFVLENVPAALAGKHAQKWERVEAMLKRAGYNVTRYLCQGVESGLAQKRRRLFMIAWQGSEFVDFNPRIVSGKSLREVLSGVDDCEDHDPVHLPAAAREGRIARHIPPGMKLSNVRVSDRTVHTWEIPEVFGKVTKSEVAVLNAMVRLRRRDRVRDFGDADAVAHSTLSAHLGRATRQDVQRLLTKAYLRRTADGLLDLAHTYNGKYRRASWGEPAPTVDTHFGEPTLFLHPKEHRGFTPREAARIQGFRDGFRFEGGRRAKFKMIGNAVPPPMAARLAGFIREALVQAS